MYTAKRRCAVAAATSDWSVRRGWLQQICCCKLCRRCDSAVCHAAF